MNSFCIKLNDSSLEIKQKNEFDFLSVHIDDEKKEIIHIPCYKFVELIKKGIEQDY